MNCPFCNSELKRDCYDACVMLECHNPKCQHHYDNFIGREELWQELMHTRKVLDVAVDALKDNLSQANFTQMLDVSRFHCIRTKCELALEQIRALEQKDVK